jgi:cytosine/adenosine deaminase-related metal-dependent hydrolase
MPQSAPTLFIRGASVWDPAGDIHRPAVRDVLVAGTTILSVTRPDEDVELKSALRAAAGRPGAAEVIEAAGKLLLPGFVNAHYHSYDSLQKGLLEDMPFDVWALHSQPAYFGARSRSELRARTLVGAIECLKHGITTVQDMSTLVPQDEAVLDTILAAYEEVGMRVVFSIALRDQAALDIAPFLPADMPPDVAALVAGAGRDPVADLDFVEAQLRRQPATSRRHWALSASGPQRASRELLEGVAVLAERHRLPLTTHVYETKAQTAKARKIYGAQGGSMIRYMDEVGLLRGRTTLAHGVWLLPEEIALLAERGAGVAHNPMSNLKLKNGVAPIRRLQAAGVNLALGCDNCSCSDCQSMFQAMKLFCLLASGTEPEPVGVHAADAIAAATLGGAYAMQLENVVGAIAPGLRADLVLVDLSDIAFMPLNSVARQLVFSETGRAVETVIVDGRVVLRDRRLTTLDETAFAGELDEVMRAFRHDFAAATARNAPAIPYLLAANQALAAQDVGLDRYLPKLRDGG